MLSCLYHSDLEENEQNALNTAPPISPDEDDDESYHALHRDLEHEEYDSDSASVPPHIKRISVLQRKVKALEATLKQYNDQQRDSMRRGSVDMVDSDIGIHHDQQPTPVSDGGYAPRTKGNVV